MLPGAQTMAGTVMFIAGHLGTEHTPSTRVGASGDPPMTYSPNKFTLTKVS